MTSSATVAVWERAPAEGRGLAAWAAEVLGSGGIAADALYVATTTAGSGEAMTFWREAQDVGLAFASPRLFPWALANSPTGAIAQALGIRGPTYTMVGRGDAVDATLGHAAVDLADGSATAALVVGLDGFDDCLELAAVVLIAPFEWPTGGGTGAAPTEESLHQRSAAVELADRFAIDLAITAPGPCPRRG